MRVRFSGGLLPWRSCESRRQEAGGGAQAAQGCGCDQFDLHAPGGVAQARCRAWCALTLGMDALPCAGGETARIGRVTQ